MNEIERASKQLIKATRILYKTVEHRIKVENMYKTTLLLGEEDGSVKGSNPEKRAMSMAQVHPDLTAEYEQAKAAERKATLDEKLARLHLQEQRDNLRLLELQANLGADMPPDLDESLPY